MKNSLFKNKLIQILCLFIALFATVAILTQLPAWLEKVQANAETQGTIQTPGTTLPTETHEVEQSVTQPTTRPTTEPTIRPSTEPTITTTTHPTTTPEPTTPEPTTQPTTAIPTTPKPTTPIPTTAAPTTPIPTTAVPTTPIPTTPTPTTQPTTQPTAPTGPVYPQNIVNNFGSDPKTDRNFTWVTAKETQPGFVEYCKLTDFMSFEAANIIRAAAGSYLGPDQAGMVLGTNCDAVFRQSRHGLSEIRRWRQLPQARTVRQRSVIGNATGAPLRCQRKHRGSTKETK